MTDLEAPDQEEMAAPKTGKRDRLVAAARQIFHEHGVETTTLADIAYAADVPPGNVYYYFKAKDDLVDAVVNSRAQEIRAMLHSLERHRTPKARLRALVHVFTDQSDLAAQSGCPLGSLCQELDKRHDGLDRSAAKLMQLPIDWAEQQFRLLGRRDARDLAVSMIASYQGISLLTNTFRDPGLMVREARRLERWIDSLA
jgi:AcrR family transcriptional regulator